jgi:ABC-2 type transport system ATP-binding protein
MSTLLEALDLTLDYGGGRGVYALNIQLESGDIVGLAGPNGAGKTTTLGILAGIISPTSGQVSVHGNDPLRCTAARRHIGFAPDLPPAYPELTVHEQLTFAAALQGLKEQHANRACDRVIDQCALTDVVRRPIRSLSAGYRKRLGLAMALVHDPGVLLLDEPTEGLDPHQVTRFRALLQDYREKGAAILSSHNFDVIAGLCNRLIVLKDGRTVSDSNIETASAEGIRTLFTDSTGTV